MLAARHNTRAVLEFPPELDGVTLTDELRWWVDAEYSSSHARYASGSATRRKRVYSKDDGTLQRDLPCVLRALCDDVRAAVEREKGGHWAVRLQNLQSGSTTSEYPIALDNQIRYAHERPQNII